MLRSIGMAIIAVAVIAILATLTVLPVILALLGRHINALSLTRFIHIGPSHTSASTQSRGGWYVLSEWVMRGAIPIVFCVVALLLVLGSPFLNAKFSLSGSTALPTGTSARIVADRLSQDFPNQNKTTMDIVVQTTGSPLSSENLARLNTYVQRVLALPHMSSAQSLVTLDPHLTLAMYQQLYAHPSLNPAVQSASQQRVSGDMTLVTAQANIDPDSAAARALVTKVRSIAAPNGLTMQVGGTTADEVDQFASLDATIPAALAVMLCAILLLLFLMTGSVIMPLKAIVLNMLSLSAVFGSMVWIFQDGHLQRLLDFQASGSLDATEPILIFTIAFGLSMDYEVFLLSRIKEQFDKTGNNRESVSSGLQKTGWLITSAALLLAAVVAVFATSKIIMLKEMGIGLALAVLIDALLIRTLLVPSMMRLLGKWNWWAPRPLQVLWQRIGFQEYESEPETVFPDLDADQDEELVGSNA
jgi:RND superfamily putative drug exporter